MGTLPQPSRAPRFRDRLSHLSLEDASRILGPDGRRLLTRGGALELAAPDDLRIDEHEARVQWEPGPGGLTARLFFDPSVRGGLRAVCSACTRPCEHVGGLLSILLEQKTDLGLAAPPPDVIRATDEEDLVAQALEERAKRAKTERMKVRSVDPSTPWTDYTVANEVSGKTYRVALRGDTRGVSYCSCPDFKVNTLGTCKHVMKVLSRTKAFPREVRDKPYRRTRITVHLRYVEGIALAVALPQRFTDEVRAIVQPLVRGPIEVSDLVRRLQKLEAGGHGFFVTPDAEEFIERQLLAARLAKLVAEIRGAPDKHRLRTSLLKQPLLPYPTGRGSHSPPALGERFSPTRWGWARPSRAWASPSFSAREGSESGRCSSCALRR